MVTEFILSLLLFVLGASADDGSPQAAGNCSEAYLDIMRDRFGCKRGSLYYCSRGLEYDIDDVGCHIL